MQLKSRVSSVVYDDRWLVVPKDGSPSYQVQGQHGTMIENSENLWFVQAPRRKRGEPPVFNPVAQESAILATCQKSPSTQDAYNDYIHNSPYRRTDDRNATVALGRLWFPTPTFPIHVDTDFPPSVGAQLRPFVESAHKSWEPVAESFSLANDLLEWREVKDLMTGLSNKAHELHAALKAQRFLWKPSANGTVNAFLQWNFGVAPLIGDIQSLAAAFYRIRTRLRFLQKIKGTTATLHSVNTFTLPDDPPPANWGTIPWAQWEGMEHVSYKFVVGAKVYSDLQGLDDASAYIKAFGAYAGFDKPLRIAWNAIPYSFLIDWTYNIGDWLGSFRIPTFDGAWDIHDPWWSCRASGSYHFTIAIPVSTAAIQPHEYCRYQVTKYTRNLGILQAPNPPWSPLQKLLFDALVYSNAHTHFGKYLPKELRDIF